MIAEDKIIDCLAQAGFSGMASGIRVTEERVTFVIEVDPAQGSEIETLRQKAEQAVSSLDGALHVTAIMTAKRQHGTSKQPKKRAQIENLAPSIKHIIAVASGKGGVGKSTVAVNLAVALAAQGYKTGLMDADIYGPSAPMMLGIHGKPEVIDEKLQPLEAHGLKIMSMGFLVAEDKPMIWRGPMIQTALRQFLEDVNWGDLDILVVDMPPGTGDAQLTMAQKVPLSGAVIVSTPQDIALLDARKGLNMFRQVSVPVFGIIENMSVHICPRCEYEEYIFGQQGAEKEAKKLDCDFLGAIPLHIDIRTSGDNGTPVILAKPDSPAARVFKDIAKKITAQLAGKQTRAQAL